MPPEASLPDDLKPLVRRHALELRHTRFDADAVAITNALEGLVLPRRFTWRLIVAGTVVAAGVAGAERSNMISAEKALDDSLNVVFGRSQRA
jgi:hypothetical protein